MNNEFLDNEGVNFAEIGRKLRTGLIPAIGLALTCVAIATIMGLVATKWLPEKSEMFVAFSFPGFEKGQYPDGSRFSPDDLRSADVVSAALQRRPLKGVDESLVRSGIEVFGIVPPAIIKERDRLRASGQIPPIYIPDEYSVSFSLEGANSFASSSREAFLLEVVSAYIERFRRTYAELPPQFGQAFESLKGADYFEYEIILRQDIRSLRSFLAGLAEPDESPAERKASRTSATTFRSRSTNLSFRDLLNQVDYFSQIRLNEVLGLIQSTGLSKQRELALLKMDYRLTILAEEEKRMVEEESIVRDLMTKAEGRSQSYVLGIKGQMNNAKSESPLLDQGLIDSLVQNDSYNFLVRRALEVGNRARDMTARREELKARRERLAKFTDQGVAKQDTTRDQVNESLQALRTEYDHLLQSVRATYDDFSKQQLAGALRVVQPPHTPSVVKRLLTYAFFGGFIGLCAGFGMSLMFSGRHRNAQ